MLILSNSTAGVFLLGDEGNEGAFGIRALKDGFCFVGRSEVEREGYDAVVGICLGEECHTFLVGTELDDFSYSVEAHGEGCVALITLRAEKDMDTAIALFNGEGIGVLRVYGGEGKDMGWFIKRVTGGYLVAGGVKVVGDWDILVLKLDENFKPLWVRRFGTGADEYAYSVASVGNVYYVVGRTNLRGNWDGFVLILSEDGRPVGSWLIGSERKDYLRFVGTTGRRIIAVGRTEVGGESDLLIFDLLSQEYRVLDGGGFDYGRVFLRSGRNILIGGDTETERWLQGFILEVSPDLEPGDAFEIGGEEVESLRFLSEGGYFAGYTYSYSAQGDMLIGKVKDLCLGPALPFEFKKVGGRINVMRYRLSEREYLLNQRRIPLKVRETAFQRRRICPPQE
jgi:hypothetical protein